MRYTITPEQRQFFRTSGYLELDELSEEPAQWARLAGELSGRPVLRFGFQRRVEQECEHFVLARSSCMLPLACGLLVHEGKGMFFVPRRAVRLVVGALLIAYAEAHATYRLCPADPHTHALKAKGLVFGDRLTDETNPVVYTR